MFNRKLSWIVKFSSGIVLALPTNFTSINAYIFTTQLRRQEASGLLKCDIRKGRYAFIHQVSKSPVIKFDRLVYWSRSKYSAPRRTHTLAFDLLSAGSARDNTCNILFGKFTNPSCQSSRACGPGTRLAKLVLQLQLFEIDVSSPLPLL